MLKALAALSEALSSAPRNRMVAHTICNECEIWCPLLVCKHTCRQNTVYMLCKKPTTKLLHQP